MSEHSSPGNETLLPCPFCGTAPALVEEADFVSVACPHYYCNFSQIALRNRKKAIERWNTRLPAQGKQESRIAERLADVVMMLDTPDAYNRAYIAAVCRSILSSFSSTEREGE